MIRTVILFGDGTGKNEKKGEGNWEDQREREKGREGRKEGQVLQELPDSNVISHL